jgi:hypothetical protein
VLAELAELRVEELRELFGNDDGQIFWNLGKVYFGSDGNVKSIDLKRAHPALNALWDAAGAAATQDRSPSQLVGILPPWVGMIADQVFTESYFTGKDWRFGGKAAEYGQQVPTAALGVRARIALDDALSLTFPYRTAERLTQEGAHGDDSLLWSERPTRFKGDSAASKLKAKFAARAEAHERENESLLNLLIPLLPESNRDAERAREQRIVDRAEQPAKKKKAKYFGADRGGSGYFGAADKPSTSSGYFGTDD